MNTVIRVGIVGANAHRGWAHDAHIPAIACLTGIELVAVSARTQSLAEEARVAFGAPRAFGDSLALVSDSEIDLVAITVKVPEHRAIVLAALRAGKHIYCEWPLGCDLAETLEIAEAVAPNRHVAIGLQALASPAVCEAIRLVRTGAIGKPKIIRVFSPTAGWGHEVPPFYAYLQDKRNGATLETIAGGHTLATVEAIVGRYLEVDARKTTHIENVRIQGTGKTVQRTCADHMMILGSHDSGCVSSVEVIGGTAGSHFVLELIGEHGWLKITGVHPGGYQLANLQLQTSVPTQSTQSAAPDLKGPPANVAAAYAQLAFDIRHNEYTTPDFNAAVLLTRLLDIIDVASRSGQRQRL
jgi:predicted dehydrogenase